MALNLSNYPYLSALTKRQLTKSWIWSASIPDRHLKRMERALSVVQHAGFSEDDLDETLNFLLNPMDYDRWLAGSVELLGLERFAEMSVLRNVGWYGSANKGGSAPFDAEVSAPIFPLGSILVDFKPAAESGLKLLLEMLEIETDKWASRVTAIKNKVSVWIDYEGVLTKKTVGENKTKLKYDFSSSLCSLSNFVLPITVPLMLSNGASVNVTISYRAASNRGFTKLDDKAKYVRQLLLSHVEKKARHVKLNDPPFLLMYIVPYGHPGADVDEYTLQWAARSLDRIFARTKVPMSERWLGVLFFSQTSRKDEYFAYFRGSTAKKFSISRIRLAKMFGAELWPVKIA